MCVMNDQLRPTVWRTARALANESRLRFLRAVFESKGTKGVSKLAEELGVSISTASIYLRALNARGLVDVRRESSHVFYGNGKNRSLPEAQRLQAAFGKLFASKHLSDEWPSSVIPVLRAYANARRIEIVKAIAAQGPLSFSGLSAISGIPETSLLRHLSILLAAGVVAHDKHRQYVLVKPKDPLGSALQEITTSDS